MGNKVIDFNRKRDARDGEKYRLAQAQELQLRFQEAHGHVAHDITELEQWASQQSWERPIVPRKGLIPQE